MRGSGTDKGASATVAAGTTARAALSLVAGLAVNRPGGGRDAAVCHCDGWVGVGVGVGVGAAVLVVVVAAAVAAAVGARVVEARVAGGRPRVQREGAC